MRLASKSTSARTRRWGQCGSTCQVCPSTLYGQEAHVKPACYRTQRGATPNRGNHLSTTLLGPAFLRTLTPERVFLSNTTNKLLTWILWHSDLHPMAIK